jgi:hypothetical protein
VAPAIKPLAEATRLEIEAGLYAGDFRMHIMQSRRDFLATLSAAGAAGVLGTRLSLADEGPPETTTLRLPFNSNICNAPAYVADDLLRAEDSATSATCHRQAASPSRRWLDPARSTSA